jgi:hypothetical protein
MEYSYITNFIAQIGDNFSNIINNEGGKNVVVIYLIISIIVSLSLLFSLRRCLDKFDKLEVLALFFFCSGINQQVFYFISSMFKFVKLIERHLPLTIVRLDNAIISPSLLVWTMYLIIKTKALWLKIVYCMLWMAIAMAMQRYEIYLKALMSINWVFWHQLIKKFVTLVLAYVFMLILHNALKKDKVIE